MHGVHSPSTTQKTALAAIHLASVAFATWILLAAGDSTLLGLFRLNPPHAQTVRVVLLLAAGYIYFVRMTFGLFTFLRRRVDWPEVVVVGLWLFVIHTTFALLGSTNASPPGVLLFLGPPLYALGSLLNTASERQRHQWKQDPRHSGQLYTGGLFRYARHINYFGDIVLFTGYALLTGRLVALAIPVLMTLGFLFEHAPKLDRHLASRYGRPYHDWAARTPRLIPWVY